MDGGCIDRRLRALLLSPFVAQKLGTFLASESSSSPARSHLPSTGPTRSARSARAINYMLNWRARGRVVATV